MSRVFIAILGTIMILMSASVLADGDVDQKKQVIALFKEYKASLKARNNEDALKFAQQMYALTPAAYGKISQTHATATFNLAYASGLAENYEASAKYYRQHVEILDKLKVPKDEKYLGKLRLVSQAYTKYGNFDKAAKYDLKILSLARDLKEPDKILAEYELKLGIYYTTLKNKRKKARRHVDQAYDLFLASYGAEHIKTAQALFWRAKFNLAYRNIHLATKNLEEVLSIYEEKLPVGHDKTLQVYGLLVAVHDRIGNEDKSRELAISMASKISMASLNPSISLQKFAPIYYTSPIYPIKATKRKLSGYVVVEFDIDEIGLVENVKVLESSHKMFEKAAMTSALKYLYTPTIEDGKRVKTEDVTHKITFTWES